MNVRPTDELMELYQELTRSSNNYLHNGQQQQQPQQSDNAVGVPSHSFASATRKSSPHGRTAGEGLVESRSTSAVVLAESQHPHKSRRGVWAPNPRAHSTGTAGLHVGGGNVTPSRRTALLLSFLQQQQQYSEGAGETVREFLACWLCETVCAEMGWLNTPALYHSTEDVCHAGTPSYSGHCDVNRGNRKHHPFHSLPVTLLTLCARCSAACSLPLTAPHADILRKAGATRALAQRTDAFVTAVREYKQRLELLAADVPNATHTQNHRSTHQTTGVQKRGDVGMARQAPTLLLYDYPHTVQYKVIEKLMTTLRSTLDLDTLVTLRGWKQTPSSQRSSNSLSSSSLLSLSPHERDVLRCELAWLQRQLEHIEHGMNAEAVGEPLRNTDTAINANMHARSVVDTNGNRRSSSSTNNNCDCNHSSIKAPVDRTSVGRIVKKQLPSFILRKTEPKQPAQSPATAVVRVQRRDCSALDRMMERALLARQQDEMRSGTTVIPSTETTGVSSTHVEDDALLLYFEGRLKELPRFKLIHPNTQVDECKNVIHLNHPLVQEMMFQTPQSTSTNDRGSVTSPNITPIAAGTAAVDADMLNAAMHNTAALLTRVQEEEQRRMEAEATLMEAHKKIAALEMTTDQMAESLLRLRFEMGHHLCAMQELMRTLTVVSAEFAMQKTLLFSDEVEAVMRRRKGSVYTAHWRFGHGAARIAALASQTKDNDIPIRVKDICIEKSAPAPPTPIITTTTAAAVARNIPEGAEDTAHIYSDAPDTPAFLSAPAVTFPSSLQLLPLVGDAKGIIEPKL